MKSPNPRQEYLMLFRGEHWDKGLSPEELQKVMGQVMNWFEGLKAQGRIKAGQPLGPEGTTVSRKQGRLVADGPFAESKEAVGGYLLLEADNFEEAVAIAKRNPTLEHGISIEVRPVLEDCPIFQRVKESQAEATIAG